MSKTVIRVENVTKKYQLGSIGTGTLSQDLNRWWARVRGKTDPTRKIGENDEQSGEHWALKGVSFDIRQGEAVGIIGKNGAGKSTLLKILSRVTTPTSGHIRVKGRIASLLEVGTGFHPDLTGRENIFMNGAILGMHKAEIKAKFNEIVDFSGVEKYIDTPVKRYSSGMYVRLAFAVAAHLESEILILDEVLAVGDAEFQKKCLGKMGDVANKEGRTVLFVSHNMAAVEALCSRGIILKNGYLHFSGPTNEVVANYTNLTTRTQAEIKGIFADDSQRIGTGEVKVTSIEFQDEQGRVVESIPTGKPVQLIMKFINQFPDKSYQLIPGISIESTLGVRVSLHHSRLVGKVYKNLPAEGEFVLSISELNLVPSVYTIRYSLVDNGKIIDGISSSILLNVTEANYYGHGEIISPATGILMMKGEWNLSVKNEKYVV